MDKVQQFFKFLEKKKGKPFPLSYKIVYAPDTITEQDLHVPFLNFYDNKKIKKLPDHLVVDGNVDLFNSSIEELPNYLTVGNDLYIDDTEIDNIPFNLIIKGQLYAERTPLSDTFSPKELRSLIHEKGGEVSKVNL